MDPAQWVITIINNLIRIVIWPVFAGLVVIMFIWAGILYLTAHGDPIKLSQANKAVIFAIIGVVVGLLSISAISFIRSLLGVPAG